jgi:hypothetical protein
LALQYALTRQNLGLVTHYGDFRHILSISTGYAFQAPSG